APTTTIVHQLVPGDPRIAALVADARGVIHLAGMSRVKWGELDRTRCWAENVGVTATILDAAVAADANPWLIYASSREVYGEPAALPVRDEAPVAPLNIYGASKAAAEALVTQAARQAGLMTGILRFSTVYGGLEDHDDRLIPAFVQAAVAHRPLHVFGAEVMVDPTWIGDVIDGVMRHAEALTLGAIADRPILLSRGTGITLLDLARRVCALTGSTSPIEINTARDYDAARFHGAPLYARQWLGWQAETSLDDGIREYAGLLTPRTAATGS
ncbi:MAG: NAD-dependent epimerase/dehydratase family protein, partial [Sphingomonadaceae bacterium]